MTLPPALKALLDDFCQISEVEGIFLAGSHGAGTADPGSDFDLYIYSTSPIPKDSRTALFKKHGAAMEIGNTFWEEEDDGWLGSIAVEFIYRSWEWIEDQLDRTLVRQEAWVGFTTCFWANVQKSVVIFDRSGRGQKLFEKSQVPYPELLRQRIIEKNLPLLTTAFPNYFDQVKKALSRQDWISVQHRCAAYLASWFDILWAINRIAHPGEKKLVQLANQLCSLVPENWETHIKKVCGPVLEPQEILTSLKALDDGLKRLLKKGS